MSRDTLISLEDLPDSFQEKRTVQSANQQITEKRRQFSRRVNDAMLPSYTQKEDGKEKTVYRTKEEKLAGLDAVLSDGLKDLESGEVMQLFSAYRNLGAYGKMIEVYKAAENEDFLNAPLVREQLATAYRANPNEDPAAKRAEYEEAISISKDLIERGVASSISYDTVGRSLRALADRDGADRDGLLKESVSYLEKGFKETLDASVGLSAMHGNIMLGNTEKARETAKVVYMAALRDGAEDTKDFYTISAALQAACIAGEDAKVIDRLFKKLEKNTAYAYQLDNFSEDMDRLAEKVPSAQINRLKMKLEQFKGVVAERAEETGLVITPEQKVERDHAYWAAHAEKVENQTPEERRKELAERKLDAVIGHSYNYRGCGSDFRGTSRVGGNMEFGGQLPDHTVSKKDLELFTGLIKKTPEDLKIKGIDQIEGLDPKQPLSEIKDPEIFMKVVDKFVRQTFTTENFAGQGGHLEENALAKNAKGESRYDATVAAVERACGKLGKENGRKIKDKNIDTRTNIAAIFALGMGDCRHHAQVKQIMFDMYQKQQMDKIIGEMYGRVEQGQTVDLHGEEAGKFYDIVDTELRTADIQVRMPVQMRQHHKWEKTEEGTWQRQKGAQGFKGKQPSTVEGMIERAKEGFDARGKQVMEDIPYSPRLDERGRYIADPTGKMHNLEDHTLCWLVKKNREGELVSLGMRDAFYQDKHYHWGSGDLSVDEVKVSSRGKPIIPAGIIPGEKTDSGEPIPIYQIPTSYNTGRRDTVDTHSIGTDICLVGMRVSGFETVEDFANLVVNDREKVHDILNRTLEADPQKKTKDGNYNPAHTYDPIKDIKPNQQVAPLIERIDGKPKAKQEAKDREKARRNLQKEIAAAGKNEAVQKAVIKAKQGGITK